MNIEIGTGAFTILGLIFITLKLIGIITWSWWWVLAPIWIPIVAGLFIWLVIIIIGLIVWVVI